MIVDCHTHILENAAQIGLRAGTTAVTAPGGGATAQQHAGAAEPVGVSFVLGFESRLLSARIPNQFIASYVRQQPARLVGFAGIDPTDPIAARDELDRAVEELGFKGLVIAPAAQGIHPADTRAMTLYERASTLGLTMIVDTPTRSFSGGRLAYGQPVLLDEVACAFPDLRIIVAHMGYPWVDETVVLLAKNANVYADVGGLSHKPWQAYNAILSASRLGVTSKLLFASDFPFGSPTAAVEALYHLNQLSHGTNLPNIPREQMRVIVEQDALGLLGIEMPESAPAHSQSTPSGDE